MSITAVTVTTDRSNYSRYSPDASLVNVTAVFNTAARAGDDATVTATIQRLARNGKGGRGAPPTQFQLMSITQNLTDGQLQAEFEFDLTALLDTDGFSTALHSKKFNDWSVVIEVLPVVPPDTVPIGTAYGQANFCVTLFTIEELRGRWLFGIPLIAVERVQVRNQPQLITGVTVTGAAFNSRIGGYSLVFTKGTPSTLQWAGGAVIPLVAGVTNYVLPDTSGTWIGVSVDFALLPSSSVTETLYLDYGIMSDEDLLKQMIDSTSYVERMMHVRLEPTIITTRQLTSYFPDLVPSVIDDIIDATPYYQPMNFNAWLQIELPLPGMLRIDQLIGMMNRTNVTNIDQAWLQWDQVTGKVSLVPSNSAIIEWYFYGPGLFTIFLNYQFVPGFWNVVCLSGLSECPDPVREYIGVLTALALLRQAAMARFPAGQTGYSVSRDGVSESQSRLPGIYTAFIDQLRQQIGQGDDGKDQRLYQLRDSYRGPLFTAL